jgi:hypothetical protein
MQQPIRMFVETKRGGKLDVDQIRRHFRSIAAHPTASSHPDGTVLIGLTKEPLAEPDRKTLIADGAALGITFAAVTFSQIVEALRAQCAEFEQELLSIVDDYDTYLAEQGLLEERNQYLVVFPCGVSSAENERFGLYYEPPSRSCKRNYRFIGVYKRKTVALVGTVEAIAVATCTSDEINFEVEAGTLTDDHRKRISDTIAHTPYYDLRSSPHRFYVVDKFAPTDARKTTPQGIMGFRYLDLSAMISGYNPRRVYSTEELAKELNGATWQ